MPRKLSQRLGRFVATTSLIFGAVGIATTFAALGSTGSSAAAAATTPTIYVANSNSSNVTAYPLPSSGGVAPTSTLSPSALNGPFGEIFDAAGNLWVANSEAGTLLEFTPSQLATGGSSPAAATISSSSLADPNGMAFDRVGNLWGDLRSRRACHVHGGTAGVLGSATRACGHHHRVGWFTRHPRTDRLRWIWGPLGHQLAQQPNSGIHACPTRSGRWRDAGRDHFE